MATQSLNERWTSTPTGARVFLIFAIIFGFLGLLNAGIFLSDMAADTASTYQWAAALGLGVGVNACYWLFAWEKGTFRTGGKVLLAAVLLLFSLFAFYVGLQALQASSLGVGLLDA